MVKLMLVGEAWGADEETQGLPFVGASGWTLNKMLKQVGIVRRECYITNVFNFRPQPTNDVKNLCGSKATAIAGKPALMKGKYVKAIYAPELNRLHKEVEIQNPNLIVALGATAAWALLDTNGIAGIRGAPLMSSSGHKVLPTYHPAAVQRDWKLRPIVIADLTKARAEQEFPEIRRPHREIWIEPDIADIKEFYYKFVHNATELSIDIETSNEQITCIGFAPAIDRALVIPFFSNEAKGKNYWPSHAIEVQAWNWVRRMCLHPGAEIVGQNFLYDINFLWTKYGIPVPNKHDTMLLHHALQPEMKKSLGFLGSIYTNEAVWKFMGRGSTTIKREG